MAGCKKANMYACCSRIIETAKSVMDSIRNKMRAEARKLGYTEKEYAVISALWRVNETSVNDISAGTGLPKSTVSRIVDQLVRKKAVKRERPSTNRRSVRVSLNSSFKKKKYVLNAVIKEMASSVDRSSARKVLEGLEEFDRILKK